MKEQVRKGVFETNSSSTHSITMCLESEYDKWLKGELFLCRWSFGFGYYDFDESKRPEEGKFYTREQVFEFLKLKGWAEEELILEEQNENMEEILSEEGFFSYSQYNERLSRYYEGFEKKYSLESGENIVAFGYYGEDN